MNKSLIQRTIILLLPIYLASCAHSSKYVSIPPDEPSVKPIELNTQNIANPLSTLESEPKQKPKSDSQPETSELLLGITLDDIEKSRAFARKYDRYWDNIDRSSTLVRARVLKIIQEMEMPLALQFVPVVESAYNPYALSSAGAMGLWQIMPRTAHHLKLRNENGLNARRDIELSTRAALQYFSDLHQRFGNWPLALAAYHLGPNAVARRLTKETEGSWEPKDGIDQMPVPTVTKQYIQQILGLISLYESGEMSFTQASVTAHIDISGSIDLSKFSEQLGISESDFYRMNPQLDYQQYFSQRLTIHIPSDLSESAHDLAILSKPQIVHIKIKPGDSWYRLAKRYHTNVHHLKSLNESVGNTLYAGKNIRVPVSNVSHAVAQLNPLLSQRKRIYYKVRKGDTLWDIAQKFGTTPNAISRFNQLHADSIIRPGEHLWIYARIRPS